MPTPTTPPMALPQAGQPGALLSDHWDRVYRRRTPKTWDAPRLGPTLRHVRTLHASGALPLDASIVDVGAGTSPLLADLLDLGFRRLTAVDLSSEALAQAQRALGARAAGVHFVVGDARDDLVPSGSVSLWHDRAAFHFLTAPADQRRYRRAMHRALQLGGYALVWAFAPEGPDRCSRLPAERYSATQLAEALQVALVSQETHAHITPSGSTQHFTVALLQKRT